MGIRDREIHGLDKTWERDTLQAHVAAYPNRTTLYRSMSMSTCSFLTDPLQSRIEPHLPSAA